MERDEAIQLLRGGEQVLDEWNRRRAEHESIPSLRGANLHGANLIGADLRKADLRKADLSGAFLIRADFSGADLSGADLIEADVIEADVIEADVIEADLGGANLRMANLHGANLRGADLRRAFLSDADLSDADLSDADLSGANLRGADLFEVYCGGTGFSNLDLSVVRSLEGVRHRSPSSIGIDTLSRSRGSIPARFLRGCGLTPWEILAARIYDPAMTPPRFVDLQYKIFDAWTKGKGMINGCFMSYSWKDEQFVDKLCKRLENEEVNVWLDRHDMVAGTIQDQVWRAIQVHHVVILVLSKDSVQSDWVENELDMARAKEKAEKRAVLCPIALDDAWKTKVDAKDRPGDPSRQLWRTLTQKLVVDFSGGTTEAFDGAFEKLLRGLKVNYGPGDPPAV
jgi:hypothetical protein